MTKLQALKGTAEKIGGGVMDRIIENKAVWHIFGALKSHCVHGRDAMESMAMSFCKKHGAPITRDEACGLVVAAEDLFESYCE